MDWSFEFRCEPNAANRIDRVDHFAAAPLFSDPTRCGKGDPTLCPLAPNRRDRLFSYGIRHAHWRDESPTHRVAST